MGKRPYIVPALLFPNLGSPSCCVTLIPPNGVTRNPSGQCLHPPGGHVSVPFLVGRGVRRGGYSTYLPVCRCTCRGRGGVARVPEGIPLKAGNAQAPGPSPSSAEGEEQQCLRGEPRQGHSLNNRPRAPALNGGGFRSCGTISGPHN